MFGRVILAPILVLSLAPAVQAAEGADCIRQAMPQDVVEKLPSLTRRNASERRASDTALAQVTSVQDQCAATNSWSEDATRLARMMFINEIVTEGWRRSLIGEGVSEHALTLLERRFRERGLSLTVPSPVGEMTDAERSYARSSH